MSICDFDFILKRRSYRDCNTINWTKKYRQAQYIVVFGEYLVDMKPFNLP